jgi:hypothetical protein
MVLLPKQNRTINTTSVSTSSSQSSAPRVTSSLTLEPLNFKDADRFIWWHTAMKSEIAALHASGTWSLVPFDPSMNVVDCWLVYKIKRWADGVIDRYKPHLVARGFTQKEGIDYLETFNPVVKLNTVWLVLTIVVFKGWKIWQLDVHNVFLSGIKRGCLNVITHIFYRLYSADSCLSSSQVSVWFKTSFAGLVHTPEWLPFNYWFTSFQGWYLFICFDYKSWCLLFTCLYLWHFTY